MNSHVITKTREELEARRVELLERQRQAAVADAPQDSETEWATDAELREIAFLLDGD